MKRSDFLKGIGIVGAGSLIPLKSIGEDKPTACSLLPQETAGPFPTKQLSSSGIYFRKNIIEDRTGVRLNLKIRVIGIDNCSPVPNTFVDIWHCDKDGVYSSYAVAQNPGGSASTTWLRGYQVTDVNGEVEFETIFPGWYGGRVCHIHFQIQNPMTESNYNDGRISQLTFDPITKNAIYASNSLYTKGSDPMTISSDNVFSDGSSLQMCTLTVNSSINGYDGYLEVVIPGSGTTGIDKIERGTGGQFKLGQNYPNPYNVETSIPFSLVNNADVKIDLYDLNGRLVYSIRREGLIAGEHIININTALPELSASTYLYRIEVSNKYGVFRQAKIMTAAK